ncbi:DUF6233 domain-containing protein [Streptomyces albidoflavus]|uniref:Uncharacterized protein n=1 Tax=Streptomyces wadayamensis TaxID=141454 RepID=A0ABR4S756_9ACTN|nr:MULTISPECIES: DUF6233 domain-containing protein [Streptomyces]KDR60951.1 hypothetical protein DC60_02915 [Streptomyces wadayamensis]QXQ25851.1 hypothetical protein STALF2_14550 [Streptomyces albidoflavus]QXQ31780.1 hypothetical protein STALF4_14600 [Streptomyces albidoflavus]
MDTGAQDGAAAVPGQILMSVPDGQTFRVRLYARQEVPGLFRWRYLVGVPSWVATPEGVEASEYQVWVTDRQLTPIEGEDLSGVPTHRLPGPPAPPAPGWVVVPAPERRGRTVVHDAFCPRASSGGKEIGTMEALDALMRFGARACTDCDAAVALVPALELGEGYS